MTRRQTATSQEILSTLKSADTALSHQMIQDELSMDMNRATIYRVLNRFVEDGLVHKVVGEDGKQYFALCDSCEKNDHKHDHFHFQCNNCGLVECLSREINLKLPGGYRADNFNGVVSGICARCS